MHTVCLGPNTSLIDDALSFLQFRIFLLECLECLREEIVLV